MILLRAGPRQDDLFPRVRRGTVVAKAFALGAQAALIGRPMLWDLAADGENGAFRVLDLLKAESELAMALCGARTVGEIDRRPAVVSRRPRGRSLFGFVAGDGDATFDSCARLSSGSQALRSRSNAP